MKTMLKAIGSTYKGSPVSTSGHRMSELLPSKESGRLTGEWRYGRLPNPEDLAKALAFSPSPLVP